MSKCKQFLDFFDYLVQNCKYPVEIPDDVAEFYETLKSEGNLQDTKPLFTETGLEILEYLQNTDTKNLKAKDIADGMAVSSRKISGAIRKLVADGYVDKFGKTPVIYSLTEKGKNFNIKEFKELNQNG